MKVLKLISRVILGILFIFSGFVKALDPLGFAYKLTDYFLAFNIGFLESLSLALGIFLSAFELVLGIVILLGYQKRISYQVLFYFMSFFTLLTFILALTNPVTDCGCFGDAIVITNWQTFIKNLIFMGFVLVLFRSRKREINVLPASFERGLIVLFFIASFMLSIHGLKHLPILDFRPYRIGTNINEAMTIPEGAPLDEYLTTLIYRNNETDINEEFTIENYPKDTIKYSFVTSESKLIKKGYEPPIHDFGVMDNEGFDLSDEILSFEGYTLFLISHNLQKANESALISGNDWNSLQSFANDFKFVPITSASSDVIQKMSSDLGLNYKFYSGDEIMLKTMVRSNPGYILLKNGTILGKWSFIDFSPLDDWNNKWPDLIQQYQREQDPEIMLLIEAGYMDDLNWDMIDFDKTANRVIFDEVANRSDGLKWTLFIFVIISIVISVQFLPGLKKK